MNFSVPLHHITQYSENYWRETSLLDNIIKGIQDEKSTKNADSAERKKVLILVGQSSLPIHGPVPSSSPSPLESSTATIYVRDPTELVAMLSHRNIGRCKGILIIHQDRGQRPATKTCASTLSFD